MAKIEGKTQSYSREYNNKLVISCLKNGNKSANDLFKELNLSNATMYKILNDLEEKGFIVSTKDMSENKSAGRRQVIYSINNNYGYILAFHIANFQIDIAIYNMKEEIVMKDSMISYQYNHDMIYDGLLRSTQMCMDERLKNIPLKAIVVSLPGRRNHITKELVLSKTFDENIIKDQSFIIDLFKRLYPNIPRYYYNYVDVLALAEMHKGCLVGVSNAAYFNVDHRLGGSFIFNGVPFQGDRGLVGEVANFKVLYGSDRDYLDRLISFEYLIKDCSKIIKKDIKDADELVSLYHSNPQIKEHINQKVDVLGRVLANMSEWFDITNIVIGGKCVEFGEEYLNAIKKPMLHLDYVPNVMFATLGNDAKHIGLAKLGVDALINSFNKK